MKIIPYTLKYARIVEAVSKTDIEQLSEYGCQIIDIIEIGEHTITLVKMPSSTQEYQLGFSRTGTDFTDYKQQWSKYPAKDVSLTNLAKAIPKIREWIEEYGPITISSSVPKKMQTYYRIFRRFGFKVLDLSPEIDGVERFGRFVIS